MKSTMKKVWRAVKLPGGEHKVLNERKGALPTKQSSCRNMIKKLFGRGEKNIGHTMVASDERGFRAVTSDDSSAKHEVAPECLNTVQAEGSTSNLQSALKPAPRYVEDSDINDSTASSEKKATVSKINPGHLADPAPLSWVRPAIRWVVSENDFNQTRNISCKPFENSDSPPTCPESSGQTDITTDSTDAEKFLGSLEHLMERPQSSVKPQQTEQLLAYEQISLEDSGTAKQKAKCHLADYPSSVTDVASVEGKGAMILQIVETSQNLEQKQDMLRDQCGCALTKPGQSGPSALNRQIPSPLPTFEERKAIQKELDDTLKTNRILATRLVDAQIRAANFERRMSELSEALDEHPNEVANIRGVIELKDKMFSELELRAGECLTELIKLEDINDREKQTALREIACLKAKLDDNERLLANLRKSKATFRRQCESLFKTFESKVFKDDLENAVEKYFQTTLEDNLFLQSEVERQAAEISSRDLKIETIEIAVQEAGVALEAKTKASDEARTALNAKEIEIAALQMELDSVKSDLQSIIKDKDELLADVEEKLQETRDEFVELLVKGRNEFDSEIIKSKDDKIKALEEECHKLHSSHQSLECDLKAQVEAGVDNVTEACMSAAESKEAQEKLEVALVQIEDYQEQIRGLLGLPVSIKVVDVFKMKKALGEAQLRIRELENAARAEQHRATQTSESNSANAGENKDATRVKKRCRAAK
ncbi:MHC class II transactivator [Pseudocyphellaria aurata]|nr:MHC class II transactivator [Pseudocyphellaria aurata]